MAGRGVTLEGRAEGRVDTSMAKVSSSDFTFHIRDSPDTSVLGLRGTSSGLSKEPHKALGLSSRASSLVSKGMAAISMAMGDIMNHSTVFGAETMVTTSTDSSTGVSYGNHYGSHGSREMARNQQRP
ncbi:hypothetical protein B9Z65_5994 [Elsinoe australis]|uniref:Uncharacterized protein n=1 Tax=Elsinoe australis TaxID=40998 RepID=A0A2P7YJP2_9PEZI|nr:hypothetical protein B9Z65_5994 [Elsinoe australis]